jgi:hypothetical protein
VSNVDNKMDLAVVGAAGPAQGLSSALITYLQGRVVGDWWLRVRSQPARTVANCAASRRIKPQHCRAGGHSPSAGQGLPGRPSVRCHRSASEAIETVGGPLLVAASYEMRSVMDNNGTLDLVAEDLTGRDWESTVRYLVGDDLQESSPDDIQACCSSCNACCVGCAGGNCDNSGAGWCTGNCW